MAFIEAALGKDANLVFDTGTERVDLTMRGFGGVDETVPNDDYGEMSPFTQGAVYRASTPADWALAPSGLYYGAETRKVDVVRSSQNLFVFYLQGLDGEVGVAGTEYYWRAHYTVFTGMPKTFGDSFIEISGITFPEREPSVYGTEWYNSVAWTPDNPPSTSSEDNSDESLSHDWAFGPPVILYDIESITIGSSPVLKAVILDGADRFEYDIPTDRARCGILDFDNLTPAAAHTGSATEWPTSGTNEVHIRAANLSAISMRFGVGYRSTAS